MAAAMTASGAVPGLSPVIFSLVWNDGMEQP